MSEYKLKRDVSKKFISVFHSDMGEVCRIDFSWEWDSSPTIDTNYDKTCDALEKLVTKMNALLLCAKGADQR
jgi:hypothetical protein